MDTLAKLWQGLHPHIKTGVVIAVSGGGMAVMDALLDPTHIDIRRIGAVFIVGAAGALRLWLATSPYKKDPPNGPVG
jgi:nucleoside phosphorylase